MFNTHLFQYAQKESEILNDDLEDLDELKLELANFFCEDVQTFRLEECLSTFNIFCDRFTKAIQENKDRKIQEEKAEQRRKEREEQLRTKRRSISGKIIAFVRLLNNLFTENEFAKDFHY